MQPTIAHQGKIVAEWFEEDQGWLVMFPDGKVAFYYRDKKTVERIARRWFAKHADIGIGEIEWIND